MSEIDRIHHTLRSGGTIGAGDAVLYGQHHTAPFIARIAELEADMTKLKTVFRVNMLRAYPSMSHDEITAAIDAALTKSNG